MFVCDTRYLCFHGYGVRAKVPMDEPQEPRSRWLLGDFFRGGAWEASVSRAERFSTRSMASTGGLDVPTCGRACKTCQSELSSRRDLGEIRHTDIDTRYSSDINP